MQHSNERDPAIRAAAFDLDGTLLYTIPDIAASLNHALSRFGMPTHSVEACMRIVGGGIRQAVIRAVPPGTGEEAVNQVLEVYLEFYFNHCTEKTDYYPGVPAMLAGLAERGIALGILSNKTEATVQKIVKRYFPDVPFRCVLGRVDGRPLKPAPEAAAPLLEALGVPAAEAAYVGDSGLDMKFARAAGMLPVAAPWGYRAREELVEQGAVLIARDAGDLLEQLLRA